VFVVDFTHYLGLHDGIPGPTRRLGDWLSLVVRAATAGPADVEWTTAVACAKRPARQPCPGYVAVHRNDGRGQIVWRCDCCGDDGVVRRWEGSFADLRPADADAASLSVPIDVVVGATDIKLVHHLPLLDPAVERMVFRATAATTGGIELTLDAAGLDELVGSVAAEAKAETNLRRRKVFDELCDRLESFARTH
jgi:hypothetical protein